MKWYSFQLNKNESTKTLTDIFLKSCLHRKTFAVLRLFCAILQGLEYFFSTIWTTNLDLLSRGSLVRVQHGSLSQAMSKLFRAQKSQNIIMISKEEYV